MIYCQECGAANDRGNPTCRLCGRGLHHQRGAMQCANCQELVGIAASFCANCGATSSDVALGTVADGGPPPNASTAAALITAPAHVDRGRSGATGAEAFNLGADLDLPDWLKRAAAAAPPASPTSHLPVHHGPYDSALGEAPSAELAARHLAATSAPMTPNDRTGLTRSESMLRSRSAANPIATGPAMVDDPPLPPIPDGGLAASMPTWLKSGSWADAAPVPPATEYAPRSSLIPSRSLVDDPTDTASFITESDLPEWLRQLAATEAAQAEEAERAARDAATAESLAADAASALSASEESEPAPPTSLAAMQSGDDFAASGRWLSRHGDPSGAGSGRRTAFANLVEERDAEQDAITDAAAPIAARSSGDPLSSSSSTVPPPDGARSSSDTKRLIAIGALLLVIAILLAYLVSVGSLG